MFRGLQDGSRVGPTASATQRGLEEKTRENAGTYEWIVAILVGLLGGVVNAVLFGGGFALPRRTSGDGDQTIYDPGFIGTTLISAAAAFLTWAYSTDASFLDQTLDVKPIAGALIAGILGARALSIIVDRQYGESTIEQTESAVKDLAASVANRYGRLEQVSGSRRATRRTLFEPGLFSRQFGAPFLPVPVTCSR